MITTFNNYVGPYPIGFMAVGALAAAGVDYYASAQTALEECQAKAESEIKGFKEWGERLLQQAQDLDAGKTAEEVGLDHDSVDYYLHHVIPRHLRINSQACNEKEAAVNTFTAIYIAPHLPTIRDWSPTAALGALATKLVRVALGKLAPRRVD